MKNQGFSLVELSIVLVILGLLVGGILAGQSLIRAAELRSVTTEYQRYIAAVNAFRDKYFAIPGDMKNAQSFWGIANVTATDCVTTVGTGTQTCNGNGDGLLLLSTGSDELFRFWQHLSNAGLIEGSYTGTSTSQTAVLGTNVPRSRVSNAGWGANNSAVVGANAIAFEMDYGNLLRMGGEAPGTPIGAAVLKPEELWNIDTKLDDGKPGRGKLIARLWDDCTVATANSQLDTSYDLANTAIACSALFPKAF